MAKDIKLKNRYGQEITYSGVETVTIPTPDSTTTFSEPKILQTKTITTNGTHNPDQGYNGFSQVIVDVPNPATGNIEITNTQLTDVKNYATAQVVSSTLKSENIKNGVNILGIDGSYAGIIPEGNINITNTQQTNVAQYATAQVVDANLVAENIKSGVSVLGINGSFTADATAAAGDILAGKDAYVNGNKVSGSITSKAAETFTPGTSDQTISAGQYLAGDQVISGDADLVAGNIKVGTEIFGVTGTFTNDADATAADLVSGKTAYVNGNKVTGTYVPQTSIYKFYQEDGTTEITDITVAGLANAYYYTKNGGAQQRVGGRIYFINGGAVEGTDDKFYVYDTGFNSANTYTWATTTTSIADVQETTAADSLGRGKQNTSIITGKSYGGTAWTYISGLNSSVYQGCNDWFIGSILEYDMLRRCGISQAEAWFAKSGGSYIWSSVEHSYSPDTSWRWFYSYQGWSSHPKSYSFCVLPLRAF